MKVMTKEMNRGYFYFTNSGYDRNSKRMSKHCTPEEKQMSQNFLTVLLYYLGQKGALQS